MKTSTYANSALKGNHHHHHYLAFWMIGLSGSGANTGIKGDLLTGMQIRKGDEGGGGMSL